MAINYREKRVGVILAAGLGTRLYTETSKPLIPIANIELLIRSICSLEIAGCKTIIIVLGWKADTIKNYTNTTYNGSAKIIYVYNEKYKYQNGISVLCARPFIRKEFILTMADHIIDDKIMNFVRTYKQKERGATLCVDYKLGSIFDMDDATKVYTEGNSIKKIGKEIKKFNCIDTGVFIGTKSLMDAIEEVYQKNGDASLTEGVQFLADKGEMETIDIEDAFWQDVDTPEMLANAERILLKNRKGSVN